MIRDPGKHNILFDHSEYRIVANEITVAEMDTLMQNTPPPRSKKKKHRHRTKTRFDRMTELKRKYPRGTFSFARVDTAGCFEHSGQLYKIADEALAYSGLQTNYEIFYNMDQVMILDCGCLHFFDQALNEIDKRLISRI